MFTGHLFPQAMNSACKCVGCVQIQTKAERDFDDAVKRKQVRAEQQKRNGFQFSPFP